MHGSPQDHSPTPHSPSPYVIWWSPQNYMSVLQIVLSTPESCCSPVPRAEVKQKCKLGCTALRFAPMDLTIKMQKRTVEPACERSEIIRVIRLATAG